MSFDLLSPKFCFAKPAIIRSARDIKAPELGVLPGFVPIKTAPRIFTTDFGKYPTGSAPSDWTAQDLSGGSGVIVAAAGSKSGNAFRFTNLNTGSGYTIYSWDRIAATADIEILIRARHFSAAGDTKPIASAFGRGSALTAGFPTYYKCETRYRTSSTYRTLTITNKAVAGASTVLAQNDGPAPVYSGTAPTAWLWNRFRLNGSSVLGRSWQDGNAEPGTWLNNSTDTSIAMAGLVGLAYTANTSVPQIDIDFFGVALGGLTVPVPA